VGPAVVLNQFKIFQTISNPNQTQSNLIRSKQDLSKLEKFEIKYGCERFEMRNNLLIGTSLESKWILNKNSRKLVVFEFQLNLMRICLEPQELIKFGQKALVCT
jgi:hypothetical protein